MTTNPTLFEFLQVNVAKKSSNAPTHTRIPDKSLNIHGGSYFIAPDQVDTFNTLYCRHVFQAGRHEYLTEKQCGQCVALDFDFKYAPTVTDRAHTPGDIVCIVEAYMKALPKFIAYDGSPIDVFVFEKPHVNRLADLTKDGIHVILGVKMDFPTQLKLREHMISVLPPLLSHLPLANDWGHILDESISRGTTNWQLYGSKKPGHEAYKLVQHLKCSVDPADGEVCMDTQPVPDDVTPLFPKLSVRYPDHPEFPTTLSTTQPARKADTPAKKTASHAEGATLGTVAKVVEAILESDPHFFDDYDAWARLGFIVYNTCNGNKDGADLFHSLSLQFQTDSGKKHDESNVMKQYYNAQASRDKKLTIATLYAWLAKLNPNHPLAKKACLFRFATDDDQASDIIYDELKGVLKSYKGRLFYLHGNVWVSDRPLIDDHVLNFIMKSNVYLGMNEKTNKPIAFVQNVTKARKVQDALYSKVRVLNNDEALYDKFHSSTKGKLVFEDGILDFKTATFTLWADIPPGTIFTTTKINCNYADYFGNPDFDEVAKVKRDIFDVLYGAKTPDALAFLSRALAGHHEDKRWATYMGNRNSGKGVEYDLLANAFESYVSAFELGNMMYCRKTSGSDSMDSKKLYWLMDLEFVRLAVSQEVPDSSTGLKASGAILKKITGGGDTIVARRNFDRYDTHFKLDTSFYIKGNNTLECDNVDCDETRLQFESVTQFKTQEEIDLMDAQGRAPEEMVRYRVADPSIKERCKSDAWKRATIYLMLTHYRTTPVEVPKHCDVEDNTLLGALHEKFEFTHRDTDKIVCAEVYAIMKDFDRGKVTLELAQFNIHKKKDNSRGGATHNKWCFWGIKLRPTETGDNETP